MQKTMFLSSLFCLWMLTTPAMAYDLPLAADTLPDSCAKTNGAYKPEAQVPCAVLDDFITAWNIGDGSVAKTLNYPHVRLSGGKVRVWETVKDYAEDQKAQGASLAGAVGWKYTKWDYRYIIQAGQDGTTGNNKYHVALSFTRYDDKDKAIPNQTFKSFYIITNVDGHWGIQSRSSMAGILVPGAAY